MSTTQQHEYKLMREAFEHRHGAGTWESHAYDCIRDEFIHAWSAGYAEKVRWTGIIAVIRGQAICLNNHQVNDKTLRS
jgi:hypothetical protein